MKLMSRVAALALTLMFLLTPVSAQAEVQCPSIDPASMVLTMKDFGPSESAYSDPLKTFGNETWYKYGRDDWEQMVSHPTGYMYGVVAPSSAPGMTYQELVAKELGKWKDYWNVNASRRGDESAVYQRLTTWETYPQTPMVETMIVMRKGCAVHLMVFTTMDEHNPKALTEHYAALMEQRL